MTTVFFTDELRGEIFEVHRKIASPGDWWCRLDSDEIYIDDPRQFLADIPERFGFVLSATCNFYFTDVDLENYKKDPAAWLARPVQERLKHYQNNWSEPRFLRHRNNLEWLGFIWPDHHGRTYPKRIRLKHFPYRSPEQIAKRLQIRQKQPDIFRHEATRALPVPLDANPNWAEQYAKNNNVEAASWQDRIRKAAECDLDRGDGSFNIRHDLMPSLPSPVVDTVKVGLQSTNVGRAILAPILRWRRAERARVN